MAKKGKLSKAEVFYIIHNPNSLTLAQLAKELDRTEKQVAIHFKGNNTIPVSAVVPSIHDEVVSSNNKYDISKFMGVHKRKGKPVGNVMTPAASELADKTRKHRLGQKNRTSNAIHRPRNTES